MTIEEINILQDIVDVYEKEDMYPLLKDKQIRTIKKAIEALKAQEWIPVSESPKREKKEYLIQTNLGYICVCRWTNVNHFRTDLTTDWHWHIYDIPRHSKIVAWKERPELYKAESEE